MLLCKDNRRLLSQKKKFLAHLKKKAKRFKGYFRMNNTVLTEYAQSCNRGDGY